jgi:hypothetical protein
MPRVDPEINPALYPQPALAAPVGALPHISEDELETPPLPREHPKWVRDAAAVSQRARAMIAKLQPLMVRVLTFWDHHVRSIRVGGQSLEVDASGSYRLEWDF